MNFDNTIKTVLKTLTLKESYDEYDFSLERGDDFFEGILVKDILPNEPEGDDVFVLEADISMPYDISAGEEQSWDSPGEPPSAEITDVNFYNATVYRYVQATDEYTEVTPESIGQEVYNELLSKLKAKAEELAIKDAYDNIDAAGIVSGRYRD
jgi:hypothetical protein